MLLPQVRKYEHGFNRLVEAALAKSKGSKFKVLFSSSAPKHCSFGVFQTIILKFKPQSYSISKTDYEHYVLHVLNTFSFSEKFWFFSGGRLSESRTKLQR